MQIFCPATQTSAASSVAHFHTCQLKSLNTCGEVKTNNNSSSVFLLHRHLVELANWLRIKKKKSCPVTFYPAGQRVYNFWPQPGAARLSYGHTTCVSEPAVCLKLVWGMHVHFWVLRNPSTLKMKGKKMQKTALLIIVGSQQTCPLSAHLSPVAALNPLVPSPLTTYCHLLAAT